MSSQFEQALAIGRPPNITRLFPQSKALIVSGKVIDRAMTVAKQCDLLLANILAGPLIQLAPLFARVVKTGGQLVLSGILPEQADQVTGAYQAWFDFAPLTQEEDWVRLAASRNAQPAQ